MTAPVRIEASAWGDLRFATLARLCGFADAEHALIKVAKVWSWQTEHYTPDAPTYEVDPEIVESALGPGGAGHMVRARLAEEGPHGLRIKGSEGRIEWLYKKRHASALGGEATKRKHKNKSRPPGPPEAQPEPQPTTGPQIGPLTLSPDLPSSETLSPRAIPPGARYDAESPADRMRLTRQTYERIAAARVEVAAELGLQGIVPMPACDTPAEPIGFRDLRERIRCEGSVAPQACEVVIATLVREAREEGSVEWLSEKAFTEGGWRTARNGGGKRKRVGPRGSPTYGASKPRTDHPETPAMRNASEVL